jgi:hypothetical protein
MPLAQAQLHSWRPPSRPHTIFPQSRGYGYGYGYGPARQGTTSRQSLQRHERSDAVVPALPRGGRVILHHGHIRPVLVRDWSPKMDGIVGTIWASQTTLSLGPDDRLSLTTSRAWTGSVGTADRRNRNLNLDTMTLSCPDATCEPQLRGQCPRNLQLDRTIGHRNSRLTSYGLALGSCNSLITP